MENVQPAAQFWNENEWEELDTPLNESFNSIDSAGSVQTEEAFACSYVLYEKRLAKEQKNIYGGVKYIGQTTDPSARIADHKYAKRMTAGVVFIVVAEHEGTDSIKLSLRDEYSLYRKQHLFKNLEKGAKPGNPDNNGTSAQARKESLKGEQIKSVFDKLEASIRTGNTWDGRKLFACEQCKSNFSTKQHLTTHVQSHHKKQKPHKCQLCQQSFFYADGLTNHIKQQHEEKQELTCPYCDQTFSTSGNLQSHLRTVHDDPKKTECKCTKCGWSSLYPRNVKRHMMGKKHECSEEEANAATGTTPRRKSGSAEDINDADEPEEKKRATL